MKPELRCTSVASVVSLFIVLRSKRGQYVTFRDQVGSYKASHAYYAPPFEGFWTKPQILLGEAPLSDMCNDCKRLRDL